MEIGIKYCVFYIYKKKINGVRRKITRMVCWEDSLEDAEKVIRERVNSEDKLEHYIIVAFDITDDISKRLGEYKVTP